MFYAKTRFQPLIRVFTFKRSFNNTVNAALRALLADPGAAASLFSPRRIPHLTSHGRLGAHGFLRSCPSPPLYSHTMALTSQRRASDDVSIALVAALVAHSIGAKAGLDLDRVSPDYS